MTHILILRAVDNREITEIMSKSVIDVLTSHNCTFDEISIQSSAELSIALTLFVESKNYEGAICIGNIYPKFKSPMFFEIYKENLRNLNEFSSYYAFPVGICLLYTDGLRQAFKVAGNFAFDTSSATIKIINTIKQMNSLENEQYVGSQKHN